MRHPGRCYKYFLLCLPILFILLLASFYIGADRIKYTSASAAPPVVAGRTAAPFDPCPQWSLVSSPTVVGANTYLNGVASVSADNIWAVGGYTGNNRSGILVEHWDGTSWEVVPSPNVAAGGLGNGLQAIAVVSSNDLWAVGEYYTDTPQTLTIYWDGTSWSLVPSPNVSYLYGVAAISANDVWAVGTSILHWDGMTWSVVPSPNIGYVLYGVAAISANDVWAVGTSILHWDGTSWSVVSSLNGGNLRGVAVVSAHDIWAVGYDSTLRTLVEHWDGITWSVVPSPNGGYLLYGVAAISANDVWAVGFYRSTGTHDQTLLEHWDGIAWSIVPSLDPGALYNYLYGVTAVSADDIWAVGVYYGFTPGQPLVEHYSNPCATPTATPTPCSPVPCTSTPTYTVTPTPTSTSTPTRYPTPCFSCLTPTPTLCPLHFSDVQQSDYFYEAVRYLYCRGVVSGYLDGTFRPYNNTTREQLSKMVVLAMGWVVQCPQSGHFLDVPPGSPFYCFIETAYNHAIISGYADGTFRPGNSVTRGQLCKIVVLACGWSDACPSLSHFSDVPPGSTFFCYVEAAYSHSVISGYADGTFRPGNSATRGQICKIIYEAVWQRHKR